MVCKFITQDHELMDAPVPYHVRQRRIIITSLIGLLITVAGELAIQWYGTSLAFSTLGTTRLDIFVLGVSGDNLPALGIISILLTCLMQIIADGLIVRGAILL